MKKLESDFETGIASATKSLRSPFNIAVNEGVLSLLWIIVKPSSYEGSKVDEMQKLIAGVREAFFGLKQAYEGGYDLKSGKETMGLKGSMKSQNIGALPEALERFSEAFSNYVTKLQNLQVALKDYDPEGAAAWIKGSLFVADWISTGMLATGIVANISKFAGKKLLGKAVEETVVAATEETVKTAVKSSLRKKIAVSLLKYGLGYPAINFAVSSAAATGLQYHHQKELENLNEALELFEKDETRGKAIGMLADALQNLQNDPIVSKNRKIAAGLVKTEGLLSSLVGELESRMVATSDSAKQQWEEDFWRVFQELLFTELAVKGMKNIGSVPGGRLPKLK